MNTDVPLKWHFRTVPSGVTRYRDIPMNKALDEDLETFVREVLQNANDAGPIEPGPVGVRFRFVPIAGADLADFLKEMGWEGNPGLGDHVDAAAKNEHGDGLQEYIDFLREQEELLLLVAEDRNTKGLVGGETDRSPFTALVRDWGDNYKEEKSSGGSHGVGKTVLWAFSGLSTVLFSSSLSKEEEGQESPRFVGRSLLPTHQLPGDGDDQRDLHGWFGLDDPDGIDDLGRPPSVWGDDAAEIADDLHLGVPDESGTRIGVVGFRPPGEMHSTDEDYVGELADEFAHLAARNFWPAIHDGDLVVEIETPSDEFAVDFDHAPEVKPLVACYDAMFEADGELSGPGDVATDQIEFEIPEKSKDGTPSVDVEATVGVRLPEPGDDEGVPPEDDLTNAVARLRGAGMVVDYVQKGDAVSSDQPFYSVLACGEAHPNASSADEAMEEFLRLAEPTEHDAWEKTSTLKRTYEDGWKKVTDGLRKKRLGNAIQGLVADEPDAGEEVRALDDMFPVMGGREEEDDDGGGGGDPDLDWIWGPQLGLSDDGTRWEFSGAVAPSTPDHGDWKVHVELSRVGEDGRRTGPIPLADVECDDCDEDDIEFGEDDEIVTLNVDSETTRVTFEGHSRPIGRGTASDDDLNVGRLTKTRIKTGGTLNAGGDD